MTVETSTPTPIRDYALIGDCHGAALVSREAGIHWYAPLRFDDDPVFFRLLDHARGGAWEIEVEATRRISRDRKSTRLNSSHSGESRMPPSAEIYTYWHTLSLHDALPISMTPSSFACSTARAGAPGRPTWSRRAGPV